MANGIATAIKWPFDMKYETPSAMPFASTAGERPYATPLTNPVDAT